MLKTQESCVQTERVKRDFKVVVADADGPQRSSAYPVLRRAQTSAPVSLYTESLHQKEKKKEKPTREKHGA